eukprot:4046414-Karenia_brevis.AAC.1
MSNFRERPWHRRTNWSIGNHFREYRASMWTGLPETRSCGAVFSPGRQKERRVNSSSLAL